MAKSWRWRGSESDDVDGKPDYGRYRWKKKELLLELCKCISVVTLFGYSFYRSLWAMIPLSVVGVLCFENDRRNKIGKIKQKLLKQFRDLIQAVAAEMRAGYSVENSFLECYQDMCMMHGWDSFICMELVAIKRGLAINITLEELLHDLGRRSRLVQLQEFASVFTIAKRSGGNMADVIHTYDQLIRRNMETTEEIIIQTAGRRMERNIMMVMPFLFLFYIEISSPGYFDPLYGNLQGAGIMSGCLIVYLTAYVMSERILEQTVEMER